MLLYFNFPQPSVLFSATYNLPPKTYNLLLNACVFFSHIVMYSASALMLN